MGINDTTMKSILSGAVKLFVKSVKEVINESIQTVLKLGIEKGKTESKNLHKQTEIRLFAYPELQENIKKYNRDIEDLQIEKPGRRSKDIVCYSTAGGSSDYSDEEIQMARILLVQRKINRDQREIDEIEYALKAVEDDEYFSLLRMKYFEHRKDEEIGETIGCDPRTVRRNKNRLIRIIAIKLYGADALN